MKPFANPTKALFFVCSLALSVAANEHEGDAILDEPGVLEFRSVITLGGETSYSLHNTETGTTFWVSENELRHGIEIVHFDPEENSLTLYVDDELRELPLSRSVVADLVEPERQASSREERRRQAREERRERFESFRESWNEAVQDAPMLSELEQELRSLAAEFRETRSARRGLARGTDEREMLREQERAVHEELRLMSEYTALHARHSPALQDQGDEDRLRRMVHRMAFSRGGAR